MLWIGSSERQLIDYVEQKTGLKATVSEWKHLKDIHRYRVVVIHTPASEEMVQAALLAAHQGEYPLPVVIWDPQLRFNESMIRPPMTLVRHLAGEQDIDVLADEVKQWSNGIPGAPSGSANSLEAWRKMLVGESQPMRELRALIRLVAPRQSTVLITGESGTGKEIVARAIHMASKRSAAELVPVNCSALPENLIEAELFGHVKGAFTGAVGHRSGRFEQAHRGTIFLDEIGEMPLSLQPKLLRVLQERQFQRVGSSETIKVDTRIIAASNIDLEGAVADKRFREDLYYRLNVVPIRLPALRERLSDVPLLVDHFIQNLCQREELPIKKVTPDAMARLMRYEWPGNVRQLEHTIEMAVTLSGNRDTIYAGDIDLPQPQAPVFKGQPAVRIPAGGVQLDDVMGRMELMLLEQALQSCGGNKAKAARSLGIKRTTLIYKLKTLEEQGCAA